MWRNTHTACLVILGANLRIFKKPRIINPRKSVDEFIRYISRLAHVIDMQCFLWRMNWIFATPTGETPLKIRQIILHFPLPAEATIRKLSIDPLLCPLMYFLIPWIQWICRLLTYTVLESDIIIIIIIIMRCLSLTKKGCCFTHTLFDPSLLPFNSLNTELLLGNCPTWRTNFFQCIHLFIEL